MRSDQLELAQDVGNTLKALPAVLVVLSLALAEKARAGSGAVVRPASQFGATAPQENVRLERLAQLRAAGVIDDQELRAEKARILSDENGGDTGSGDVAAVTKT
jgi:hypothetical protein